MHYLLKHNFFSKITLKVKVAQACPTLWDPMDFNLPGSSVHGILQARILEWVAIPFSRGCSQPGIEPRSSTLWVASLPSEPPGKPKNTGVGSLSLFQGIFPTQESNWGLLQVDSFPAELPGKPKIALIFYQI